MENQDAVPITLGQEFSANAVMVESAAAALERTGDEFHDINLPHIQPGSTIMTGKVNLDYILTLYSRWLRKGAALASNSAVLAR